MKTFKIMIGNQEHEIQAQEDKEGKWWVAVKPLCEVLGMAFIPQYRKITNNQYIRYNHMVTPSEGGAQETLCVEIDQVARWLLGVNPNRVKPEIKQQLLLFQDKLQNVLYEVVFGSFAGAEMSKKLAEFQQTIINLSNAMLILVEDNKMMKAQIDKQNALNKEYIDKRLSSVGGKLLSGMRCKKNKEQGLH